MAVKRSGWSYGRRLVCLTVMVLALGAARADAAGDTRELKAREAFAAGRFQQALDLFAKLYAETLHPVYLRNIGRCYQNLGDPDQAIISFRDYLRKQKAIKPDERAEVESFIAEMEALKKQKSAAAATPPPETVAPPPAPVAPPPAAPEPKGAAPAALVTAPGEPAQEESSAVYTRWWFWTLVGAAAVGAGLGIAAAAGAFNKTQEGTCLAGFDCQ